MHIKLEKLFSYQLMSILFVCVFLCPNVFAKGAVEKRLDVKYVEFKCSTSLVIKLNPKKESSSKDDIDCINSKGQPTRSIILDEINGFYKIFHNGDTGWISAAYTKQPKAVKSIQANPKKQDIVGTLTCRSRLRLRSGPSISYRVRGRIPCSGAKGSTRVHIIGKDAKTGWYYVNYGGEKAWVSNKWVKPGLLKKGEDIESIIGDLFTTLDDARDLGNPKFECFDYDDKDCIPFNKKLYKSSNAGKLIAREINKAKRLGTKAKKKRFLELFAPLALHIQKVTGWPASVTLAQMSEETGWGTSGVFRKLNNFGGHSCFKRDPNGSRPIKNKLLRQSIRKNPNLLAGAFNSRRGVRIKAKCTYPRPRNEGSYYRTFSSVLDAAYLYANNVLENKHYKNAQNHVKQAKRQGVKPNVNTVINGLRAYAANSKYRAVLKRRIRVNNLKRFDDMVSCD